MVLNQTTYFLSLNVVYYITHPAANSKEGSSKPCKPFQTKCQTAGTILMKDNYTHIHTQKKKRVIV